MMDYGEITIVSFFRKTRSRDDGESASCGLLRGGFGDVVDETNTTDSFALANQLPQQLILRTIKDDLGSKEKLTFDQGDLRAPPTRETKGRSGPTHESQISMLIAKR